MPRYLRIFFLLLCVFRRGVFAEDAASGWEKGVFAWKTGGPLVDVGAGSDAADPHVAPGTTDVRHVELTADEVDQADAVVVVTDHDAFDYDMVRDRARYVLDTRNRIQGRRVESL